jgi:hypothetical protein
VNGFAQKVRNATHYRECVKTQRLILPRLQLGVSGNSEQEKNRFNGLGDDANGSELWRNSKTVKTVA